MEYTKSVFIAISLLSSLFIQNAYAAGCSGTMKISNETGHKITAAVQHFVVE